MKRLTIILMLVVFPVLAQEIKPPEMPEVHKWKIQALVNKFASLQEQEKRMNMEHQALVAQINQAAKEVNAELDAAYKDTEVDKADWDISGEGVFIAKKKTDSK